MKQGRGFEKFSDLIEYRKYCPICSNSLKYEINTYKGFSDKSEFSAFNALKFLLRTNLPNEKVDEQEKFKKIVVSFIPADSTTVEIPELNIAIDFLNNKCLSDDIESILTRYDLRVYCDHDLIGTAYEAMGSFELNLDYADNSLIPRENGKLCVAIDDIFIRYEQYKLCNLYMDDSKPNGNVIKIINDYMIQKTSFSLAEVNLDGSAGAWKEKRINLVDDTFFKFDSSNKVYSRINSMFLLSDK